ncbi:sugar ABC transporter substrate-binding protein [Saccharopolyspora halophila]|uniref:Sugar ABC transporter substrate-binding protein n=1 Tax=Saccharopolyspora halophila TaxID=405551 RepID=A0ABN3GJP9_9PSEU
MFKRSLAAMTAIAALLTGMLTGCGTSAEDRNTITYWASNQGKSPAQDMEILRPQLEQFTRETGIEVNVEVIGWSDLLNRILGAATSGVGPDVVNLGNTWAASLQATGAFVPFDDRLMQRFGGRERFLESSMSSTGMAGEVPTSLPLYGLSYGVFYNKELFAEAGVRPPQTWQEFVRVAKRLTKPDENQWGVTLAGASYTENSHFAFMFSRWEGTHLVGRNGPDFDSPEAVTAVKRYLDLMAEHQVASPGDAEQGETSEAAAKFTDGDAAMLIGQNSVIPTLRENGMPDEEWGVFRLPAPSPLPANARPVATHVAGSNIAVFKDSPQQEEALQLVRFLTGKKAQAALNKQYGTLPVVKDAYDDPAFHTPKNEVFAEVLTHYSEPAPMIPTEAHFETTVGSAMRDLFARIATGREVTESDVREALTDAEQKMKGTGG